MEIHYQTMRLEKYELKAEKSYLIFEFLSEGPKGKITKIVQYGKTNLNNLYNLALVIKTLLQEK